MIRRALLGALVAMALTVATAGQTRADGEMALSVDGRTWHDHLSRPLFDPTFRWVPGDQQIRTFWVRNQGPTAASLRVAMRTADPDALLADGDLVLSVRTGAGGWRRLTASDTAIDRGKLARGDRIRVDVRAWFRSGSTNRSQRSRLPLAFELRLVQAGSVDGSSGGVAPSALPDTGAVVAGWTIWLAAALLGVGGALVRRPRGEVPHG